MACVKESTFFVCLNFETQFPNYHYQPEIFMIAQLETPILPSFSSSPYKMEGQIQVFTAPHRTFFSSAIAYGLRIAGQGKPVLVVQFLKGGISQGHSRPVRLGQNLDWLRCDLPRCIDTPHLELREIKALNQLWNHTQAAVLAGKYSLVVLDELSLAINFGLIEEAEVLELLQKRPSYLEIILTGPDMPPKVLKLADRITQIRRHELGIEN